MLFSELISNLKKRPENLIDYDIKANPEILKGASLEKAQSNQISFLEKAKFEEIKNFSIELKNMN